MTHKDKFIQIYPGYVIPYTHTLQSVTAPQRAVFKCNTNSISSTRANNLQMQVTVDKFLITAHNIKNAYVQNFMKCLNSTASLIERGEGESQVTEITSPERVHIHPVCFHFPL